MSETVLQETLGIPPEKFHDRRIGDMEEKGKARREGLPFSPAFLRLASRLAILLHTEETEKLLYAYVFASI